ncbi:hypothetical protein FN846DRAFT_896526 [Sphaerosporella brunnea]|uniref:Uncharacterized protein n=1 Tax=Sphaerosporella brunnea TaxID=1250544 RepID=A0A5J5EC62_9PEZI|nr:hypothetical protein FN846DRAFT_896526 [Sphaerosporella brunnea]
MLVSPKRGSRTKCSSAEEIKEQKAAFARHRAYFGGERDRSSFADGKAVFENDAAEDITGSEKVYDDETTRLSDGDQNSRNPPCSGDFNKHGNRKFEVLRPSSATLREEVVSLVDFDDEYRRNTPAPGDFNDDIGSNGHEAHWGNQADHTTTEDEDDGRDSLHLRRTIRNPNSPGARQSKRGPTEWVR